MYRHAYGDTVRYARKFGAFGIVGFCASLKRMAVGNCARTLSRRLCNILAVQFTATDMTEVSGPPGGRIHQLMGDRDGGWSISVSANWRLTFDLDEDVEDYH